MGKWIDRLAEKARGRAEYVMRKAAACELELGLADGKLTVGPESKLTPYMRAELRSSEGEIVRILTARAAPAATAHRRESAKVIQLPLRRK